MRRTKAVLMLILICCASVGLILGAIGTQEIIRSDEPAGGLVTPGQDYDNAVGEGPGANSEYDPYRVNDQEDLKAVAEEFAYSWDSPDQGANPEEHPSVMGHMGSEHWNVNSRAHTNTTTLITIQDLPNKAHYLEDVNVSGMLYEDNNSDGQPNAGDTPIERAQMHALWDDGSVHRQYLTFFTQEDEDDGDGEKGRWEFNFTVTETDIGPRELEIIYNGEWTQNGSWFYEVNDTAYTGADMDLDGEIDSWGLMAKSKLLSQRYLVDDDLNNGVDEEFFDFVNTPSISYPWPNENYDGGGPLDNDLDGLYDEDVSAFIARFPTNMKLMVTLWHDASISSQLSQPTVVAGESFTVKGQLRDASVPDMEIGMKTLQIKFNGQLVGQTLAVEGFNAGDPLDRFSEYSFTYTVPKNMPAGKHKVEVSLRPEYNSSNNQYYEPVNITKYVKVVRPTEIIFDDIGEAAWVYHTKQVLINGSIVDKYFYRNYGLKEGIRLNVGSESFAKKYVFYLYWTKGSTYIQKGPFYVNNTNASFSIPLVVPGDQDLGSVNVTIELKSDNTYYLPSKNYTEYVTRATTSVNLWLDQNNNGKNNEAGTYITRVVHVDENGKKHYWNTAHIKGQLIDNELSTDKYPKGVANREVLVWWAYGESRQKQFTTVTDTEGKFGVDVKIELGHVLGPVTVAARFSENPYSCYYDPSNYYDADGAPFSVVSLTTLTVDCKQATKGENVIITGSLRDDRGIGVINRTMNVYWLTGAEKDKYLKDRNNLGEPIGAVSTDNNGDFSFSGWEVTKDQPVGPVYVLMNFDGSDQWPNGPDGTRYLPTDAYSQCWSTPLEVNVSAHTMIEMDETNAHRVVRFQKFTIKGRVWEAFKGEIRRNTVKGVPVEAYLTDSRNREFYLGKTFTSNEDPATDGRFQLTETVPRDVVIGQCQVRVQFNGTDYYLKSQNTTVHEIWTDVKIKPLEIPADEDDDGKIDIHFDQVDLSRPLRFHFKFLEAGTSEDLGDIPVDYGTVWMNITAMGIIRNNVTMGVTDEFGRYVFNFSRPLRDTMFGKLFVATQGVEVRINITYEGGHFRNPAIRTYTAVLYGPEPPEPGPPIPPWAVQAMVALLIMLIILGIASFFTARWLQRRARVRGMKRIIKRAADQLVAGNEYTAVIFKSYQKLGAHLRKYGYLRRDSETFREFEEAIKQALPIDRVSMNEFLKLLEEARYSHHKIGEEQRNDAIKNLRSIEHSLERIILDESAAMRALESLEEVDHRDTEILLVDIKK